MPIVWEDKEKNFQTLEKGLEIMHKSTDLIILPETFSTGFPSNKEKDYIRNFAERNSGETITRLKNLANRFKTAICGTFIADTGGSLYNRAFFIEPSGEETFSDKRHLFSMAGEGKVFSRGYDRMRVRYCGWEIAMIICYDVRFPVWCRNVNNQYDLLIAVANWPTVRVEAWSKLLYARAIENEAYVCGVNCTGKDDNGFEYDGWSKAIDFKGKDITVDRNDGLLYATLSKEKLDRFRQKFPAWNDADNFTIELH